MSARLTDEQVSAALDALTRPIYMWRMARNQPGRPGTDKTVRRALAEARKVFEDPAGEPERSREQAIARARRLRRGHQFHAPNHGIDILVTRVDRSEIPRWADIQCTDSLGTTWRKRQPLSNTGWFPFGVWTGTRNG